MTTSDTGVTVSVNGVQRQVPAGTTVRDLVARATQPHLVAHAAVARNGEVVPRSAWTSTAVAEGDRYELLSAAQGG
jgi:sulfur carrier protein